MAKEAIGIFDSGLGGTSILKEIEKVLPCRKIIYLSDTRNFPYGEKTRSQLRKIGEENVTTLQAQGCRLIVVACNTMTVNAIAYLRKKFPDIQFVGVEPAVKPAGERSKKGIAILSSPQATTSKQLASLIARYAGHVPVFNIGSLKLVRVVEEGGDEDKIRRVISKELPKSILNQVDVLVLGCTHFPLIKGKITRYVGKNIEVIDSGKAVAKRVKFLLTGK